MYWKRFVPPTESFKGKASFPPDHGIGTGRNRPSASALQSMGPSASTLQHPQKDRVGYSTQTITAKTTTGLTS